jgi:hypothetical protein
MPISDIGAPHSITSSARVELIFGMVRPSALVPRGSTSAVDLFGTEPKACQSQEGMLTEEQILLLAPNRWFIARGDTSGFHVVSVTIVLR